MNFNILIAGSKDFNDRVVAYKLLDKLHENFNTKIVTVSKFAGACAIAQEWVFIKNAQLEKEGKPTIEVRYFSLDHILEKHNNALFDLVDIPSMIIKNDPFFQEGKKEIINSGIHTVLAFPNKEGKLGAATQNIVRFAELAKVSRFPVDQLMAQLKENMEQQPTKSKMKP